VGRSKHQRTAKSGRYSESSLADELADVAICVATLSEMLGSDLSHSGT
jgi:NTP pyrophosphatase (non-canonical NTP hydrolase)